jgi:hypothetical protein
VGSMLNVIVSNMLEAEVAYIETLTGPGGSVTYHCCLHERVTPCVA